jgi:hypothetical protein
MKASSRSESSPRNLTNSLPARPLSDAIAANDCLMSNAQVTYAPLAVWKDFHWTCTVTSFASVRERLE